MFNVKKYHIPLTLTLVRLILSPLGLPFLIVYLLPYNLIPVNCALAVFFILLSLTDFFDGYFARKFQQITTLGKILDPIADKFLVFSTLVALLAVHKIYFFWVIILIGREFFVMGLRQMALEKGFELEVSSAGKIKTAFQMVFLTYMIINPYQNLGYASVWNIVETVLLWVTVCISVWSAQQYYRSVMHAYMEHKKG